MPRLDELTARWREIETLLEASDGEITPEIESALTYFNLDEADKVDGYVFVVRDLLDRAEAMRAHAAEVQGRARTLERQADWLQRRLEAHMLACGVRELRGHARRVQYQRVGGKPPVELTVPPAELPAAFRRESIDANKQALAEALGNPEHPLHALAQTCARFGDRGETLRLY